MFREETMYVVEWIMKRKNGHWKRGNVLGMDIRRKQGEQKVERKRRGEEQMVGEGDQVN